MNKTSRSKAGASKTIQLDGHLVTISNPKKLLFKKAHLTKAQFVDYYVRIAPTMLPHTRDRPLSMFRFPDGVLTEKVDGFYQKDAGSYFPEWMERIPIKKEGGGIVQYVMLNNRAALAVMANLVCVPHIWLSRADKLEYPDRMIFDLDPAGNASFALVKWTAKRIKKFLKESLNLPAYVMTTGSRGLHVAVPLKRTEPFETVRSFAKNIAEHLVHNHPEKLTLEMRKSKRGNRIFLDYLRNGYGATGVAPYAVRARPDAPIATPLSWDEIASLSSPQKYTLKNIFRRLAQKKDPWRTIDANAVSLNHALKLFKKLSTF